MGKITSPQLAIQKTLQEALLEAQARNRAFSLRSFAKKLGVGPSSLSEILNGKRRVSRKLAERMTEKLCLPPHERAALLELFPEKSGPDQENGAGKDYTRLSADQFHAISDWYHFAILSLAETVDFSSHPEWIAQRLGIRRFEAEMALERLQRLGLLRVTEQGEVVPTRGGFTSSDDIQDLALRRAHSRNLTLAEQSLEKDHVTLRDFTAVTMAIDPERLPVAKQMIREFQDKLSAFLESGSKTEVYKVSMQLFPLTQRKVGSHEDR